MIRFTPEASLAPSNFTYVYFTGGLLDLQGSPVAAGSFWFQTSGAGDSTIPTVSAVAPAAGTSGVGINGSVHITFSEAINPISISPTTVSLSAGGALGATYALSSGNTLLTLTPERPLPAGTLVTITLNGRGSVTKRRPGHSLDVHDRQRA